MTLRELLAALEQIPKDFLDSNCYLFLSVESAPDGESWCFTPRLECIQADTVKLGEEIGLHRSVNLFGGKIIRSSVSAVTRARVAADADGTGTGSPTTTGTDRNDDKPVTVA